jgi:hypothetical protein
MGSDHLQQHLPCVEHLPSGNDLERTSAETRQATDTLLHTEKSKTLSRELFSLQMEFAARVAKVKQIPLAKALLFHTCLYRRMGLQHPLKEDQTLWAEFLQTINSKGGSQDDAYAFAAAHAEQKESSESCYSYQYDEEKKIVYIHFANNDKDPRGPLSDDRILARLAELKAMFTEIRKNHPEAETVSGNSWIYNVPNYRRLFPPSYTKEPQATPFGYTGTSVWGQFIDRKGNIREKEASEFLRRLEQVKEEDDLPKAFPLPQLGVTGDIRDFYAMYDIG